MGMSIVLGAFGIGLFTLVSVLVSMTAVAYSQAKVEEALQQQEG